MIQNKENQKSKIFREVAPYLNLGWQLVFTILFMALLGYFLDIWLNSKPIFLIIFALLGCVIGLFDFIRSALKKKK